MRSLARGMPLWRGRRWWEGRGRGGKGEVEGGGGEWCSLGLFGEDEQTKCDEQQVHDHDVGGGLHGGGSDGGFVVVVSALLLSGRES
jgi:hypothetical protein